MDTSYLVSENKQQPSIILKTRRNHGLEHATLHVLARRFPRRRLAGHSDPGGFWIVGDIETEQLSHAVTDALQRLRSGERGLAIHPNCGTNLMASSVLAGLAGVLATQGTNNRLREKLDRLPLAISLVSLALILARPLGLVLQERVTTSGDPGNLQVVEIRAGQRGRVTVHRVVTRFSM